MNKKGREEKLAAALRSVIVIVVMVLIVVATFLTFSHYLEVGRARTALYNGKTARLAAWSVAIDCYGSGGRFADMEEETGFAEGIAEKIAEIGDFSGSIRLIQTKDNGYGIAKMTYTEGEYTVLYISEGDTDTWQVYKKSVLISA